MLKKPKNTAAAHAGTALILLSGFLLSGCQFVDVAMEDYYVPAAHYEKYPIKLVKTPVNVAVAARAGTLSPGQINAIAKFASEARSNSSSKIKVSYPSGGGQTRQVAHEIAELLANQGIARTMIVPASYRGGSGDPVHLSYTRKVAVTQECGDWSEDMSNTVRNEPYPNYGCAMQQNIAAMVANPQDFETPRAMTQIAAKNRTMAIEIYLTGEAGGETGAIAAASGDAGGMN